jgi:hypothetical protein
VPGHGRWIAAGNPKQLAAVKLESPQVFR